MSLVPGKILVLMTVIVYFLLYFSILVTQNFKMHKNHLRAAVANLLDLTDYQWPQTTGW